jgi:hypothetical protein
MLAYHLNLAQVSELSEEKWQGAVLDLVTLTRSSMNNRSRDDARESDAESSLVAPVILMLEKHKGVFSF